MFRKSNQKVPKKQFHTQYCLDGHSAIEDWDFVTFEQCKTHVQLNERETFWQHRLKTFYHIGLDEKEEYLKIFRMSFFCFFLSLFFFIFFKILA